MTFNESSTHSDNVGLEFLKLKFPNARIINANEKDRFSHYDFIVIEGNTFHLVETKIRYSYYSELAMEKSKYKHLVEDLNDLSNREKNRNNYKSGNIYYLNIINKTGYLFDVDKTSKREGCLHTAMCTATDGCRDKVVKPVYFLKTSDAEKINLTTNNYGDYKTTTTYSY